MDNRNLVYSIRWVFEDKDRHEISAKTLNKSERAFLDYIYAVAKEAGISVDVEVAPRDKGSFIGNYVLTFLNEHSEAIIQVSHLFLGAAVTKFFSPNPKPKSSILEDTQFLINIQEKIQEGSLTSVQATEYVNSTKIPTKQKNAFFKANKSDESVTSLEVHSSDQSIAQIPRSRFDEYIHSEDDNDDIISNAKVFIISPVIVAGSNETWSGEYNNEKIRFYIKDKEFVERAQNKEIAFNTGFYINCELKKTVRGDTGDERIYWQVIQINSYGIDENHEFAFNHRKKANEVDPNQLSLFDFE